jgi:hypothetical protein
MKHLKDHECSLSTNADEPGGQAQRVKNHGSSPILV